MPIPVVCTCAAKLKVGDHLKGKHIKCPKCGSLIAVGGPNGRTPAPAPAAKPKADLPSPHEVLEQSNLSPQERQGRGGRRQPDLRLVRQGEEDQGRDRADYLHLWLLAGPRGRPGREADARTPDRPAARQALRGRGLTAPGQGGLLMKTLLRTSAMLAALLVLAAHAPADPPPPPGELTRLLKDEPINLANWAKWSPRLREWWGEYAQAADPAYQEAFRFIKK